jgi:UDP-glucose 4-epimerase
VINLDVKIKESSMSSNILITGIAGMIGSHLLDALVDDSNNKIIGIDDLSFGKIENIAHNFGRANFKFYSISVLDFETLKILGKDVDSIVHLAAVKKIAEINPSYPTLNVNARGTENILEIAKMWGAKIIMASTSDVYGMSTDLPFKEDSDLLLGPSMIRRWSYAVSKLYCEQLTYAYYFDFHVPIVILRYFGGFSPRSSFTWVGGHIPIFIHQILQNQEVTIHGDGKQTRSMAYIDDIVDGTIRAMKSENAIGEIINIGNDEEMSIIDSAYLIHQLSGSKSELKIKFVPMSEVFGKYKDIMRRKPDLTKAKKLLGYTPKYRMKDAVAACLETLQKQKKNIG